jgi:hypothetical protein
MTVVHFVKVSALYPRVVISLLAKRLEKPPFCHSYTSFGAWPRDHYMSLQRFTMGRIVGTLRTGYPHVQASSQDNNSKSHLPAGGSSGTTTCPHGSGSHLPARGSSGAPTCLHGSGGRPPSSGQLRGYRVSPGLQHPPSSSGQLRSYHVSQGKALQATSN